MIKLHNFFDFYTIKENETQEVHVGHAENVVCDYTYTWLAERLAYEQMFQYTILGTGVGVVPTVKDQWLTTPVVAKANGVVSRVTDPKGVSSVQFKIELLPTENNGTLFTEVGLNNSSSTSKSSSVWLYTHAVITDNQGQPITIEKKANERLLIYATIYATMDYSSTDPFSRPASEYLGAQWMQNKYDHRNYDCTGWNTLMRLMRLNGTTGSISDRDNMNFQELMRNIAGLPYIGAQSWNYVAVPFAEMAHAFSKNTSSLGTRSVAALVNSNEFNGRNLYGATVNWAGIDWICSRIKDVPVTGVQLGTGDGVTTKFKVPHAGIPKIDVYLNGTKTPATLKYTGFREHNMIMWPDALTKLLTATGTGNYSQDAYVMWQFPIKFKDGYLFQFHWKPDKTRKHFLYLYNDSGTPILRVMDDVEVDWPEELIEQWCEIVLTANDTLAVVTKTDFCGSEIAGCSLWEYDAANGVFGKKLYSHATQHLMLDATGTKGVVSGELIGTTYPIQCVKVIRASVDSITVERYGNIVYDIKNISWNLPLGDGTLKDRFFNQGVCLVDLQAGIITPPKTISLANHYIGNKVVIKLTSKIGANTTFQIGEMDADGNIILQDTLFNANNIYSIENIIIQEVDTNNVYVSFECRDGSNYRKPGFVMRRNTEGRWYKPRNKEFQIEAYSSYVAHRGAVCRIINVAGVDVSIFTPYNAAGSSGDSSGGITVGVEWYQGSIWIPTEHVPDDGYVEFATPPAVGVAITGNYMLDYLPKSDAWTLEVNSNVTFARGTE